MHEIMQHTRRLITTTAVTSATFGGLIYALSNYFLFIPLISETITERHILFAVIFMRMTQLKTY